MTTDPASMSEIETLKLLIATVGAVLTVTVAVVGYLVKRAITQLDDKLDGLIATQADHSARLVKLETYLGFGVPEVMPPHRRRNTGEHT